MTPVAAAADAAAPPPDAMALPEAATAGAVPCSSLPLCDGFESVPAGGPPNAALWSISQPDCSGAGTLTVDATQAHSGKQSVKVNGGGGYCDHIFISNASAIAALGPQVYTRVFVRLARRSARAT